MGAGRCVADGGDAVTGTCSSNADCGEGEHSDIRSICRWENGGDPADLRVWVKRADAEEPELRDPVTQWDLAPDQDQGCITFPGGNPDPKDTVEVRYVSEVAL
jgi:hypothetical protein